MAKSARTPARPRKTSSVNIALEPPLPAAPLPAWGWVQTLVLFFAATLPLYFDLAVPEVSGDIRWMATSFFAGLCALILLAAHRPHAPLSLSTTLKSPLWLWVAGGLAFWALFSLTDALNPLRGIILIKALYAQLILMVCVWWVANPKLSPKAAQFPRALLWALSAPLAITAFIGILQFFQFNQSTFNEAISGTVWVILTPLFSVLGWLIQILFGGWVPGWPQTYSLVDQLTGFFLQSAVPGGSFANKNLAGSYTAMMIPLMVYLLLTARSWWSRGLASALLSLGLIFLVFARARASWLALMAALAVGIVLIIAVPALRQAVWAQMRAPLLAWLLLPASVLWMYGGATSPVYGAYAIDRTPAQQLAALGSAEGGWNEYGGRLAYNLNSLVITRDYWLNGVGLGSFFTIYPAYYNAIVTTPTNSYNVMARPQRTHSDVMQAFTEMGIPGGALYVGLFALALAMGFRLLGPTAGRLGGALVGGGMFSALLLLTLFLNSKGMLQLPGVWHPLFLSVLISLIGWFGWRIVRLILALNTTHQKTEQPLQEWQITGFFAALGLLTICLNAFLDFPMQLPTAPAAAALLMGLIAALHSTLYPTAWQIGFKRALALPVKPILTIMLAVMAVAWVWALYDAYKFRQANTMLKAGMVRIFSGVTDDTTWQILHMANTVYSLDPRIHENLGVIYANYSGVQPIPMAERMEGLEWVLSGDPWAPNHIVNLAGMYIQMINEARMRGDEATAQAYLVKLHDMAQRLMRVADFSHISWGVMGIYELLSGKPTEAIPLLQRSLTIQPDYLPAQSALQTAISLTGVVPITVQDAVMQRAQ